MEFEKCFRICKNKLYMFNEECISRIRNCIIRDFLGVENKFPILKIYIFFVICFSQLLNKLVFFLFQVSANENNTVLRCKSYDFM